MTNLINKAERPWNIRRDCARIVLYMQIALSLFSLYDVIAVSRNICYYHNEFYFDFDSYAKEFFTKVSPSKTLI